MNARKPLIVGEQGLDLSELKDRDSIAPVFTSEQEARLRQIVREEIDADRAARVTDTASEVIRRQSRRAR